ncbi:MAG TPA: hypothetical protein PLY87_02275 [Planctomycetaceae bacterium]|nr:hypothetical protein [Planctomycetaceae bacterium]HRA87745.1 hypothetical protein [Planctomycetaceae bacterium]
MDSSRSGLLSTILMTLPLIVVPAVALLRPPGSASGVSTVALDASEDEDVDSIFDDFDGFDSEPSNGFKEKPAEHPESDSPPSADEFLCHDHDHDHDDDTHSVTEDRKEQLKSAAHHAPPSSDPFIDHAVPQAPADSLQKSGRPKASDDQSSPEIGVSDAEQILEQLNTRGALKTMWFNAGENAPVGLAAFFRGQTELTRIRFEAVGQSRDECARNVLEQVTRWQKQN